MSNVLQGMDERNQTGVPEFLVLGFGNLHNLRILLFILFLVIYVMVLSANVLVIALVGANQSLHSPMYFFLSQLSLSEILFTSNIVPNMLWLILAGGGKISVARCIFQFYLLAVPTISQCLLLAAMSLDRHVAICRPLHYANIMTFTRQNQIVSFCWLMGFTCSLVIYIFLSKLQFCGLTIINHFFCDIMSLIRLSCSDTMPVQLATAVVAIPVLLSPSMFILVTYISILHIILKMPSISGRHKAFSTCSSHLTIVCVYYGTFGFIYLFPTNNNVVNTNKGLSLLYTLVTPLLNPIIYSLRSQDIRSAVYKSVRTFMPWKSMYWYLERPGWKQIL
ncbi:olfactory receptor 6F1-like [Pseudophryne corroboree]|uniref:olfactory receptor 6F1-like n=1 Tax=Pseudophryne corroboree TaxID=495146 RepID=UPI003081CB68